MIKTLHFVGDSQMLQISNLKNDACYISVKFLNSKQSAKIIGLSCIARCSEESEADDGK